MTTATGRKYTLGEAALHLGVMESRLRRAYESGKLKEPARAGRCRVLDEGDLEAARIYFYAGKSLAKGDQP
jgi:hypothetical protein